MDDINILGLCLRTICQGEKPEIEREEKRYLLPDIW